MDRKNLDNALQPLATLTGFDFIKDLAPNIGPDWGVCVLPAAESKKTPQMIAALGVRPGSKDLAMDQALFRGAHFLAGLALFDYNRQHPDSPVRIQTVVQDKIEIKYLSNDSVFPADVQPASAIKGGYFLIGTSPEAFAHFALKSEKTEMASQSPILSLNLPGLAKAIRQNREAIIEHISLKNHASKAAAEMDLQYLLSVIDLIDRVDVVRTSGGGQMSFILQITPASQK